MKTWIGLALLVVLSGAPAMADTVAVGNVLGTHEGIAVSATPEGSKWDFSRDGAKKGTVVLTIDELRKAQSIFDSCMRMDVSGLPKGRAFTIGTVKGIEFDVQKVGDGRLITLHSTAHEVALDTAGQAQMQAMLTSALNAQRMAGGPRGGDTSGAPPDPNTLDNAKDIMHHWHPSGGP